MTRNLIQQYKRALHATDSNRLKLKLQAILEERAIHSIGTVALLVKSYHSGYIEEGLQSFRIGMRREFWKLLLQPDFNASMRIMPPICHRNDKSDWIKSTS